LCDVFVAVAYASRAGKAGTVLPVSVCLSVGAQTVKTADHKLV